MRKYYTRPCNFYYGFTANKLIQKKKALPLNGRRDLAFDTIEILSREKKGVKSKFFSIKEVKNLNNKFLIVKQDLRKITNKRKNFLKYVDFTKPAIMGILNLTPDSFSDGGKFNTKKKSFLQIKKMINSGASIIDVGGESTRPGSKTINPKIEWKRLSGVVKNFKTKFKKISLSVDTRKLEIMRKSLNYKADLINDVSGFNYDKDSMSFIKKSNAAKVLHHMIGTPNSMQNNPRYNNVLLDIYDYFEKNLKKIGSMNVLVDPGIGFGKTLKHNLILISRISLFHSLGLPILVGTSRKRFIGQISDVYDSDDRTGGTIASVLYLLLQGVQVFRVHNVIEVKQALMIFDKILNEK